MKKPKNKKKLVIFIVLSLIIGYSLAGIFGKAFKYEAFRTNDNNVKICNESAEICNSGIFPAYTVGASGGWYGFPLKTDRYYCVNDGRCGVIAYSKLSSFLRLDWVNVLIWSTITFALLYAGDKFIGGKIYKKPRVS